VFEPDEQLICQPQRNKGYIMNKRNIRTLKAVSILLALLFCSSSITGCQSHNLKALIEDFKTNDRAARDKAAAALAKVGTPAVEPLIIILKDESMPARYRYSAASTLGMIKSSRVMAPLVSALESNNENIRIAAARALGSIKEDSVEPLIDALKDNGPGVRAAAAKSLGKVKDTSAVKPLTVALKDEDKWVREAAAEALGKLKDPRAIKALTIALEDEDGFVRINAAWALKRITPDSKGNKAAKKNIANLISKLKNKDKEIRLNAAETLGDIKDPAGNAVEPLISALKDKNKDVQIAAARSLGKTKDPRAVEPLASALRKKATPLRKEAAKALGEIGDPRAVEPLIAALKDKSRAVQKNAAWALGEIGDPRAIKPLKFASKKNKDKNVLKAVKKALNKLK
jgi:HEAT repeat protein